MATGKAGNRKILQKHFEYDYSSLGANSRLAITAEQIGYSIPDGYTPLGFVVLITGNAGVYCQSVYPLSTGSSTFASLYNDNSSAKSGTFKIDMTFMAMGENRLGRWIENTGT